MSAPRARVILNPAAGRDEAATHVARINERLCERYSSIEFALTAAAGDAERAARRAVEDGCEHLLIGGGDGTLNEALNGAAAIPGGLAQTTFGIIPLGTGNDFAQALGMPGELEPALSVLLEGRTIMCDAGSVNGRCFVNVSAGGFIADVSRAVTPRMKSIAGQLAYLLGGAQALADADPVTLTLTGEPGQIQMTTDVYAFAVCNSRLIGGGRLIAPHAVVDDGLLDVCVIEAMPTLEFVALLRRVSSGEHLDDPRVHYLRIARATLEFQRPINLNTDGELLEARTCEYQVLPRAVRFIAREALFADADAAVD